MIFRRLLPVEGGGSLRQWYRLRKDIFHRQDNIILSLLRHDTGRMLPGPLTLFDFRDEHDAADVTSTKATITTKMGVKEKESKTSKLRNLSRWGISDDQVIGGYSRANIQMIRTLEEYSQYQTMAKTQNETTARSTSISDINVETMSRKSSDEFLPFLRWSGYLDTRIGNVQRQQVKRSGFCAIRTPAFLFGSMNLQNRYNALEITCRSDGRVYTVNLKVSSYFPHELYQSFITIPPTRSLSSPSPAASLSRQRRLKNSPQTTTNDLDGNFVRVVLPFQDFLLTSNGSVLETQRKLDGLIELEHIGFTLMDNTDGSFEFDLARIRVINYYDHLVLGEDDEDEPYYR